MKIRSLQLMSLLPVQQYYLVVRNGNTKMRAPMPEGTPLLGLMLQAELAYNRSKVKSVAITDENDRNFLLYTNDRWLDVYDIQQATFALPSEERKTPYAQSILRGLTSIINQMETLETKMNDTCQEAVDDFNAGNVDFDEFAREHDIEEFDMGDDENNDES